MESAQQRYEDRIKSLNAELDRLAEHFGKFVWIRTALFLAGGLSLLAGYNGAQPRNMILFVGWSLMFVFLAAMFRHESLKDHETEQRRTRRFYQRLLARRERRWNDLPRPPSKGFVEIERFADDLDLLGVGGFWQWYSLVGSNSGERTLAQWLGKVPDWNAVRQRQQAIQALRDVAAWRESLLLLLSTDTTKGGDDALPEWSEQTSWLPKNRLPHLLSWIGPGIVLIGLMVLGVGIRNQHETATDYGGWIAMLGLAVNFIVTTIWGSHIHDIFAQVTGPQQSVERLRDVFDALDQMPSDQGLLDEIRKDLITGELSAKNGIAKLARWVRLANYHRVPLTYPLYLFLQFLFMWDFRILKQLEQWKLEHGAEVRRWFDSLGALEVVLSGATVADEHRDWGFAAPVVDEREYLFYESMGHPLLPDQKRVTNNVQLLMDQPLLLVTGSNMAGKSTLLRSLGLNLLLVRLGSPACAVNIRTGLYELATSIRVRDSLVDGVSLFMAELHRLKQVVDTSELSKNRRGAKVLFLLDEILQGTNSRERQIAVVTVLQRLLGYGAIGAVSTHDLDLAAHPALHQVSQIVHFREYFTLEDGEEVMKFDYKMRAGPTPTTNALKLLKFVGLDP